MTRRHKHVVNLDEATEHPQARGRFAPREKYLSDEARGQALGCSYVELAPGKVAWPFHYHCANEEAIYVLEGTGTARIGTEQIQIRAGDYLAFPAGMDVPHQTINTGSSTLRYLCMSTKITTDVVGYPDSGKIGPRHFTIDAEGASRSLVRKNFRDGEGVDYWDGEDD